MDLPWPAYAWHPSSPNCVLQGALGCNTLSDNYDPEEVNLPKDTVKVAAGHYHSLAINGGGELWSWGYAYLQYHCVPSCSCRHACFVRYSNKAAISMTWSPGAMSKGNLGMASNRKTLLRHQLLWELLPTSRYVPAKALVMLLHSYLH